MRPFPFALGFVLSSFAVAQSNLAAVQQALDSLSESVHVIVPDIITKKAQENDNDQTIGQDINQLITVFNSAASDISAASSSSSAKFKRQSADDLSVIQANILSDVTQALNGIDTTDVPSFPSRIPDIDTAISGEVNAFKTAIGNITLVHQLSIELDRMWATLGLTKTATAAGF